MKIEEVKNGDSVSCEVCGKGGIYSQEGNGTHTHCICGYHITCDDCDNGTVCPVREVRTD